ncbi:MAG: hypothetical protein SFV18_19610 [Bryobacteraceae bacterium]|nr:hypothetical protein [Bryobacteraceae bacterium]
MNKCLMTILVLAPSVVPVAGADKTPPFKAKPVDDYEAKVALDKVAIAFDPVDTAERQKEIFGKVPLAQFHVLPVLLVIENRRSTPLDLKAMKVLYRPRGGQEIEATPVGDVRFLDGPSRPNVASQPFPIPVPVRGKKSKLADSIIEERAFAAKMIAPGESATGFVYFWTDYHGPVTLTVSGLRDAAEAKDLFFFEVPVTHR